LIGPPGSGKTIQAELLRKEYNIPAIAMSQLLEQEVNRKSPIGKALAASLDSGELLTDDAADELMKARLMREDAARGFILDGYPSTEGQARSLDRWISEHKLPKPVVIILNVPEEVAHDRMIRRRRPRDTPSNIERRLRDYREVGRSVEHWYGPESIVRVDGTGTPANVAQQIAKGIDDVQSSKGFKVRSPEAGGLKRRAPEASAPKAKQ
jgi:adenylate kinase